MDLTYEVGPGDTASLFDFDSRQTQLGFAGVGPFTVRATTADDDIDEEDETFTVRLSNPRASRWATRRRRELSLTTTTKHRFHLPRVILRQSDSGWIRMRSRVTG